MELKQNLFSEQRVIEEFWKQRLEQIPKVHEKLQLLSEFRNQDYVITDYSASLTLLTLKNVCECLKKHSQKFDDFIGAVMPIGHGKEIHIVRNNTVKHGNYETKEKETGGLDSHQINDLGEIRIKKIDPYGFFEKEAFDATVYSVSEYISV